MTNMAEVLARLTPEQRRLLVRRLGEQSARESARVASAEGREDRVVRRALPTPPLSFAQQRLWILEQLDPDSSAYHLGNGIELRGRLDLAALDAVVQELVARHETLRTTFQVPAGATEALQVIAPRGSLPIQVVDLRPLAEPGREQAQAQLMRVMLTRKYDLARGPLMRLLVLRLGARRHVLLVGMHHIISDGWSFGIFTREVGQLYQAFLNGQPSPLPALTVQYGDYAVWQRELLSGEAVQPLLDFWRQALAGAPSVIELPTDRPRSSARSSLGGQVPVRLDRDLTAGLEALGRREGATLFMAVLATYAALLARLSGQGEVVVGAPVAGRNRSEIEHLIGFFVNALALRVSLAGDPSLRALLERVRQGVQGAFGHQDVPFERLVEELRPDRDLSQSPVFQVALSFLSTPAGRLEMPGLELVPVRSVSESAPFDLTLHLVPFEGQLGGSFEFRRDLFDETTVRRFQSGWQRLVANGLADPDGPMSRLPLLSTGERHQLLGEWNDSAACWPEEGLTHELVVGWGARRPDAVAISRRGEVWSYGYLLGRAWTVAERLRGLGVGPEARVVVLAERTLPERILGSLAVMLAGGAYVPLDPSYPPERLAYLFEDAGARVILTQRDLLERLPATEATVLCVDAPEVPGTLRRCAPQGKPLAANAPECHPEERSDEGSPVAVHPANLAYVVYTSGSTGKPKGVQIPHEGLLNMVRWHQDYYRLSETDRATQVASPAFDASIWELWPYLAAGASVHIPEDETRLSAPGMVDWWQDERITLAYLPTALVEGVLREPIGAERAIGVRTVIIGGDRLVGRPLAAAPYVLSNTYGPAEYTVLSTAVPVAPWGSGEVGLPSIGLTLANTQLYVVERGPSASGWSLAPLGVPGELLIGGVGLARGYLGRPGLTAGRFVPDPFSGQSGARLYRSGDRVRRRPDGDLDFLGRFDFQVKLRGFRVELGEIEATLERHPGVGQVAVAVRTAAGGELLAAWWVPATAAEGEAPPTSDELRAWLAERLPGYMVPAVCLRLERLPLTPNGKLDRAALPAPEGALGRQHVPPSTSTEAVLCQIWEEELGVARVGIEDSFFELGGHSLLAIRVVSRIRERLEVELPLRRVFEHPTPRQLAQAVESTRRESAGEQAMPPLVPVPREGPLPLSFAQERLWFIDQFTGASAAYNVATATRFEGPFRPEVLAESFRHVIARHEVLRTRFANEGGRAVQVIEEEVAFLIPVIDLSGLRAEDADAAVASLADGECAIPFDLRQAPALRGTLLRRAPDDHALLMTQHHIVTDAWAMGLLIQELGVCYRAAAEGRAPALPPLPVQYADYAVWQRQWLAGEELERQLTWWRQQLAGAPHLHELPTDRPRPALASGRGATHRHVLPLALSQRLMELSNRSGLTSFMTLMTGFMVLLGRLSGQTDLVVGTPIANRGRRELEGLIGFLLNMLVLRLDLSRDPGFDEALDRLRRVALDAYAHQDLPFERLVDSLGVPRAMDRTPIFQISGSVRRTDWTPGDLGGLVLSGLMVHTQTSRFDLSLLVAEGPWGFGVGIERSSDLFDGVTIERWLRAFESLLQAGVEDPSRPISSLPLLATSEAQQTVREWNDSAVTWPVAGLTHELVVAWAERRPDAVAISRHGEVWSYGHLLARSWALAAALRGLGVGPEVRVVVLAERTLPERIVGSLAVMLAGGAYVPVDPGYPPERLAFLLEDAGAAVILTQENLAGGLPETPAAVLCLDALPEVPGTSDAMARVQPANLAYVVYTSGSTGKPKGVEIPHEGLLNMVRWHQDYYGVTATDRATQVAAPAFDASIWELWPYLAAGASVHIPEEETRLSAPGMLDWWEQERITLAYLPTALVEGVLREPIGPERAIGVRTIIIGGDRLVGRPLADAPYVLSNTYGPAEYTVLSTAVPVAPWRASGGPGGQAAGLPSIGFTLANTRLYVVERGPLASPWTLAPLAVPGELLIGGVGLARGYLGRPGLTAERFVPDPFSGEAGARLYRSGDRVRRRLDGDLDFLGRFDFQVKLRGFRIELGEIEAVLERQSGVAQAVVAVTVVGGAEVLAAWWVAAADGPLPDAASLRSALAAQLPGYMVPTSFQRLDALPLTVNGKLDRKALPAPEGQLARQYVAPRTLTEATVAEIWSEVLGLEKVGMEDEFFELGGHSLLATRVISRVRERLGVELPLRRIFEATSAEALAAALDELAVEPAAPTLPPLVPVPRDRPLPLSYAQERLWFLYQLSGGGPAYTVPIAARLTGNLDLPLMRRALLAVIDRHEVLRTRFVEVDGTGFQVIEPSVPFEIPVVDLSGLATETAERLAAELRSDYGARPFDLGRAPMVRASALRLAPNCHDLSVVQHHLVTDVWSMGTVLGEITRCYRSLVLGEPLDLPPLPVQYADFAVWQRQWLEAGELERQLAYWQGQLAGAPVVLELPTDRPRPEIPSGLGTSRQEILPRRLAESIREVSLRLAITPSITFNTLWATFLGRLTGQQEVLVGMPVANRSHRELEGQLGLLLNTVVLRVSFAGDPNFTALLAQQRRVSLDAYSHQDLPFEVLIQHLDLPRHLDRAPLIQSVVTVRNTDFATAELPGLTIETRPARNQGARLELSAYVAQGPWGLSLSAEYASDLFDAVTIDRWVRSFELMAQSAVDNLDLRFSELPLLSAEERQQLTQEWEAAEVAVPDLGSPQEMFWQQAVSQPDALALRRQDETWSYGYLARRAAALAGTLVELGVGPGVRVALLAERTLPERVVGTVAVSLAGGASVLLDPDHPRERLAFQLADAGVEVVLTQGSLMAELPATTAAVLCLDALTEVPGTLRRFAPQGEPRATNHPNCHPEERSDEGSLPPVQPNQLAYVIYTSGSTGRPKGVEVEQAGLTNLVHWFHDTYRLGPEDRGSLVVSPGFDAALLEVWPYLAAGASLHVPEQEARLSPGALVEWWREQRITVAVLPTALASAVLREPLEGDCSLALRAMIAGGEPLLTRPPAGAPYQLMNAYGPTEATILATTGTVAPEGSGELRAPSVGRPIRGTRVLVVDRFGGLCPRGVVGELLLGGVGLARGYVGAPGLTAERFVPDSFGTQPGARLYRTGDRARLRSDGEVEVLGRLDSQVKVRGMRVELGEIEAALERCPGVARALVALRPGALGERLVAWWLPAADAPAELGAESLRGRLAAELPAYMVPALFLRLDSLPLSASGKVDRGALPSPEVREVASHVAPRDGVEAALTELWSELLALDMVSVHDSFFALGGHSLLVPRLVTRARERHGLEVAVADLFRAPTPAGLAALLAARGAAGPDDPIPLQPDGEGTPFFWIHGGAGTVLGYRELAARLGSDRPFLAFQSRGLFDREAPRRSVREMADAYVAALCRRQPSGPYLVGGWSFGAVVALEVARRLRAAGEEVALLALIDPTPLEAGIGKAVGAEGLAIPAEWQALAPGAETVLRANVEAFEGYRREPYGGLIDVFWGRQSEASRGAASWRELGAPVREHWLEGNHETLLQEPHVGALAAELRSRLSEGEP
ncbi:MAG TPA: amino acid adenylation domain-containing protein [Thermoanaerobaculia bacterium]|nr:amino acid adenylation domain-containing protein [Thermoanaerobaculia bacterium]